MTARRAAVGDAAEIVRLRAVMTAALFGRSQEGPWDAVTLARLERWLGDPDAPTAVFVVDAPDGASLAATAIGTIDERLPHARNPSGVTGYVYGVSTDPRWRRRGFSRAAMRALLGWYADRGVHRIDLHASPSGESLYRELGFTDASGAALTLRAH
ncbi:GNAT family N-acetyltransferase [Kitasatospora sp. MAA4]|uniref:GNAT family N-acetyltransferase n=1 Tax=Kitasatospora sp. MAA4 TaxID=3035093 RepID=UPI002476A0E8|nr:GNAT family N-acetyltransferase [Kitasatospora sp. MAA4]